MTTDFRNVIAETPYDEMGGEFREIFGKWVNETLLKAPSELTRLAFELFDMRLELAKKYNTYFAKQVTEGGKELWKERFAGNGNTPCYSFASANVDRTKRFFKWAEQVYHSGCNHKDMDSFRRWDTSYAEHPTLPVKVTPYEGMSVWSHHYYPRFTARTGGSFECRTILYGFEENKDGTTSPMYLFEHPRSRWMGQIRAEATTFWNIAWDDNNDDYTRFVSLASWEWLWAWGNPFMRSGALTMDCLSMVMQERIGAKTRNFFYHQDAEALLLTFDDYVKKRAADMEMGFVPTFNM